MAGRLLAFGRIASRLPKIPIKYATLTNMPDNCVIGNREVVGYGFNGQPNYLDSIKFPFPAIRWKEMTPDICAMKEKEKGDWRKLTMDEKKDLYRASFCQTLVEIEAPTGEWKQITAWSLIFTTLGFWIFLAMKYLTYPALPQSVSDEWQAAQLRRMIDLQMNIIDGISSYWDYKNDCWKK